MMRLVRLAQQPPPAGLPNLAARHVVGREPAMPPTGCVQAGDKAQVAHFRIRLLGVPHKYPFARTVRPHLGRIEQHHRNWCPGCWSIGSSGR